MLFVKKLIAYVFEKFGYIILQLPLVNRLDGDSIPRSYLELLAESPWTRDLNVRESRDIISIATSQLGQDVLALSVNGLKNNGFFVEVGATDGLYLSNTFILEKKFGWTGIVCEPGRNWHEQLSKNRNCFIDTRAVARRSDESIDFAQAKNPVLSAIAGSEGLDSHVDSRADSLVYKVKTVSLRDLLMTHNAPKAIDFLSIDTEGNEFSILQDFDFNEYTFNVICVEHNYTNARDQLFKLLVKNGYKRVFEELSKFDDWYVRRDDPIATTSM